MLRFASCLSASQPCYCYSNVPDSLRPIIRSFVLLPRSVNFKCIDSIDFVWLRSRRYIDKKEVSPIYHDECNRTFTHMFKIKYRLTFHSTQPYYSYDRVAHVTLPYFLIRVFLLPHGQFSLSSSPSTSAFSFLTHLLTHFLPSTPAALLQLVLHRPSLLRLSYPAYIRIHKAVHTRARARVRVCVPVSAYVFFLCLLPSHFFLSIFRSLSRSLRSIPSLPSRSLPHWSPLFRRDTTSTAPSRFSRTKRKHRTAAFNHQLDSFDAPRYRFASFLMIKRVVEPHSHSCA